MISLKTQKLFLKVFFFFFEGALATNNNAQIITSDFLGSRAQSLQKCQEKEISTVVYFSSAEFKTTEPDPFGLIMSTSQNHEVSWKKILA